MENIGRIQSIAKDVHLDIKEILKYSWGYIPNDLTGACATASYTLARVLNIYGIDCKLVAGCFGSDEFYIVINHCWVETRNYIIDITAGQFYGFKDIEIRKKPSSHYTPVEKGRKVISGFKQWPIDQRPTTYHREIKQYLKFVKQSLSERRAA